MSSKFTPEFKGPIEGYVVNYLKREMWKVSRTQEYEDMMQEAFYVFLKCKARYEDTVNEPQHFMALFKTAWFHHFTNLTIKDTARRHEVAGPMKSDEEGEVIEYMGETNNEGQLAVMLRQAPAEILQVVNLFLNCPQEILDMALASWRGQDRRYIGGGSRKVCQLLGIDSNRDILAETIEYFSER